MKRHRMFLWILVFSLAAFLFTAIEGSAEEKDDNLPPPPPGPCPMGEHLDHFTKELGLTDAQRALMEAAGDARHDLFEQEREADEQLTDDERELKHETMMQIHRAFSDELRLEQPDFQALAEELKASYEGANVTEFNAMIDADAAFHESLTAAQRAKMVELMRHLPKPGGRPPR